MRKREHWINLTGSSGTGASTVYAWTAVELGVAGGWVETALAGTTTHNPARKVNGGLAITTFPYHVRAVMEAGELRFWASDCP